MLTVFARKSRTLAKEISRKGPARAMRIAAERLAISALARAYGFPASWHPPTSARPYRQTIADLVNSLEPQVVCEVGCGLGSILSRVRAPQRTGFDIDPGVVRAARLLRSRRIAFREGSLGDVDLPAMDVLILVNWIHEVSPEDLASQLLPLVGRTRYLVLDAIDPENTFGYRYKHDFAFLQGRARKLGQARHPQEGRSFPLFEVVRDECPP